jgi:hypothetical protein
VPEPRNPFLSHLRIEFVQAKKKSVFFGRNDSGKETVDWFYRERAEKTSVYKTPVFYELLPTLQPKSHLLILYIIMNLGWGMDRMELNREKICTWGGFSAASYYTALGELIDCGVVCKYKNSVFWINPAYFFKGDRFKYASENNVSIFPYKTKQQSNDNA